MGLPIAEEDTPRLRGSTNCSAQEVGGIGLNVLNLYDNMITIIIIISRTGIGLTVVSIV
jgi:hypothetical protein